MRSKVKVGDKYYKAVAWLTPNNCDGCALEGVGCLQETGEAACGVNGEFDGYIFIASGKEALAKYVLARLNSA